MPNNYKGVNTKNNNSQFEIDYPRLYNIVNHQSYNDDGVHSLVIDVKGKGLSTCIYMINLHLDKKHQVIEFYL